MLYKMNDIRLIKFIKNLDIDNKAKTKEQYEIIINVSMQEIKRLELYLTIQEQTINKYCDVEINIKKFIEYLKDGIFMYDEYNEYKRYQKIEEEMEDIYYVDNTESEESESYNYCRDTELIKQQIKKQKEKYTKKNLRSVYIN